MARPNGAKERLRQSGHALWALEYTDAEIAGELGCAISTVCEWRKRHRLRANAPTGSDHWRMSLWQMPFIKQFLRLYELGLGDRQIAARMGVTYLAARKRRWNLGLPPNRPAGRPRARCETGRRYTNDQKAARKHVYRAAR
jgi:hypothetical protein